MAHYAIGDIQGCHAEFLALLAGLTTAATLVHRREALAPRSSERPWVTVHPIGGPRLWGDLGQFEIASLAATVRVTSDPVPGPSPEGFSTALREEVRHLHDCYRREVDLATAEPTQITVEATLWPSGALTDVVATAEPAQRFDAGETRFHGQVAVGTVA